MILTCIKVCGRQIVFESITDKNYNIPFWADELSLTAWDVATLWFTDDVTLDVDTVDDVKAESPLGELRSWPSLIFIANSARLLASGIRPSGSLRKQNNLLPWRHNGRDGVSNHQPPGCLFKAQIKEIIKAPRHWPLWGEFIDDRWTPCTKGRYRGKASIWWRHHASIYSTIPM